MNEDEITLVPANEATWDDLQAIFGTSDVRWCMCQRPKVRDTMWSS